MPYASPHVFVNNDKKMRAGDSPYKTQSTLPTSNAINVAITTGDSAIDIFFVCSM